MKLVRSRKNEIFDLLNEQGFSPGQFEFGETNVGRVVLRLKNSDYYFQFGISTVLNASFYIPIEFSPGKEAFVEIDNMPRDWNSLKQDLLVRWLSCLKNELEQPDKWADLLESSKHIGWEIGEEENTQFTYQEVQGIEVAVERVKARIPDLSFPPEQLKVISAKLDYIADRAKSLGRVDWKAVFVGTLVWLVVELALPPEKAGALWSIFKEVFHNVVLISLH